MVPVAIRLNKDESGSGADATRARCKPEPKTGRNLPKAEIQADIEMVSKTLRTANMNVIGNSDVITQANVDG